MSRLLVKTWLPECTRLGADTDDMTTKDYQRIDNDYIHQGQVVIHQYIIKCV